MLVEIAKFTKGHRFVSGWTLEADAVSGRFGSSTEGINERSLAIFEAQ